MWPPFFELSSRIHTSSIGSSELLVAGGCALVLLVVLIFDSGLSSPDLICYYARSLGYGLHVLWLYARRLLGIWDSYPGYFL